MKLITILNLLTLAGLAFAVPRKGVYLRKRQTQDCSCPSDVTVTATTLNTITQTTRTVVTTDAGTTGTTAGEVDQTFTVTRTTTVNASSDVSTTTTIGRSTITTSADATTTTVTSSVTTTTVTTCIISAYKVKRQDSGTSTSNSIPQTTTLTTNFGVSSMQPATCVCRLIARFPTSSSSTCSCPSVKTSTVLFSSLVTSTITQTSTQSNFETSTFTPQQSFTSYSDVTITTTRTTVFTLSQSRVTSTRRSTVTVSTTVTPQFISCPTADLSCDNQGIRWGIYPNTNAAGANNTNKDSTYSTFNPTVFKTRKPIYQNVTYTLGGFKNPASKPIYLSFYNSSRTFESDYIVINHVGYVFAQVTGTYTFSVSQSDDITLLWVGPNAYSGYTRANANIVNPYGAGTGTYSVNFVKGQYYPIRIMFGNAQEAITFQATLTAPDGRVILTSNSKASPFLVQYSCDGTLAPAFPAFGSET